MIKQFRAQNYKALRDVTLDLTPLHVLIGPNDSGKTSILEALAALCRSADHPLDRSFVGPWHGTDLVWHGETGLPVTLSAAVEGALEYSLSCRFSSDRSVKLDRDIVSRDSVEVCVGVPGASVSSVYYMMHQVSNADATHRQAIALVYNSIAGVHLYHWNPRLLAVPVAPDASRRFRMDFDGFGLALCLDDILGDDRARFEQLENRFRRVFPDVESIKLVRTPGFRGPTDDHQHIPLLQHADGKGIYFTFRGGGQPVPASHVSDGMLLILAYLTVFYLPKPPRMLLVEEPENGIHPKRLRDVLTILRDLLNEQAQTQVIMTTHSPYVVDLFQPGEVSLCQKQSDGSIAVRALSDSKAVREQLDVFTLGEIWTAEGDEALAQPVGESAP